MDHAVPAATLKDAAGGSRAPKFSADFGIKRFFRVGRHGICDQVIAENGLALAGEVLACTDSHISTCKPGLRALSRACAGDVPGVVALAGARPAGEPVDSVDVPTGLGLSGPAEPRELRIQRSWPGVGVTVVPVGAHRAEVYRLLDRTSRTERGALLARQGCTAMW